MGFSPGKYFFVKISSTTATLGEAAVSVRWMPRPRTIGMPMVLKKSGPTPCQYISELLGFCAEPSTLTEEFYLTSRRTARFRSGLRRGLREEPGYDPATAYKDSRVGRRDSRRGWERGRM